MGLTERAKLKYCKRNCREPALLLEDAVAWLVTPVFVVLPWGDAWPCLENGRPLVMLPSFHLLRPWGGWGRALPAASSRGGAGPALCMTWVRQPGNGAYRILVNMSGDTGEASRTVVRSHWWHVHPLLYFTTHLIQKFF